MGFRANLPPSSNLLAGMPVTPYNYSLQPPVFGVEEGNTMLLKKFLGMTVLLALVGSVYAQGVPGKDRPIRVGQFKGTGSGRYWHTNIHTSADVLSTILTNKDSAQLVLGANPVI